MARTARQTLAPLLVSLVAVGCGSSGASPPPPRVHASTGAASTARPLVAAERPASGNFPPAAGRTLAAIAAEASGQGQFGPADATFTAGRDRVDFALSDSAGELIYAPTALYVAGGPHQKAQGPYVAPADPLTVAPRYRSRQYIGPGDIQAIYTASVPFPHPGSYALLALTRTPRGLIASPATVTVAPSTSIPGPGQRPPAIATDTLATTHGNLALLTTRLPPESMHSVSFRQVLGRKPIALLISTPQLCTSRVCGPVTDVVDSLQHEFAGRIAFIHQEVYVDNNPNRGLRPQLRALHLHSEPWLFTVDRRGIIAARLEGAFGVEEARAALEAALH